MMRYVVSDSGSVTSRVARPVASVSTEPSQNAERPEVASHAGLHTAAAALGAALGREHAPADDALAVVLGHDLQRLVLVDRAHHIGRAGSR